MRYIWRLSFLIKCVENFLCGNNDRNRKWNYNDNICLIFEAQQNDYHDDDDDDDEKDENKFMIIYICYFFLPYLHNNDNNLNN